MSPAVSAIILAAIFVLAVVLLRRSRSRTVLPNLHGKAPSRRLLPEAQFVVSVTDRGIECIDPQGRRQEIDWAELTSVRIRTTDTGPWCCDVFWGLHGRDGKVACVVPGGATGEQEMLAAFERLPGFDHGQVIKAMGSTKCALFTCWQAIPNTA
jgi:hypothetical protein